MKTNEPIILERSIILLRAARELLLKQQYSPFVLNLFEETVFYDGAECDGYCLAEDIEYFLKDINERKGNDEMDCPWYLGFKATEECMNNCPITEENRDESVCPESENDDFKE